jgi:predicted ATPase
MLNEIASSPYSTVFSVHIQSIQQTHPTNSMSQKYISVDGYNLAYQGSGFRLAAVLLACLVDADQTTLIIDEPELGLSPEIQATLADFLYMLSVKSIFRIYKALLSLRTRHCFLTVKTYLAITSFLA